MKRLIYLSSASSLYETEDLARILASARRNNLRNGVTGVLMYHEGSFLQMLEGEDQAIDATIARIEADDRHRGILRLVDTQVTERLFPDWAMALARPESHEGLDVRALSVVRDDLERIRNLDRRGAAVLASFFTLFRDL